MSTIKTKNIKQTVVGSTTQPLKIGGILEDGSDAKISIDTNGNTTLNQVTGIKFPATQVPSADANTLDDYEEGTFTPYIYGDTTAGVGTYSFQYGKYTKVGNAVHISIGLEWSNHTGNGSMKIGGLPFVNTSSVGSYISSSFFGISFNNGYIPTVYIERSQQKIDLVQTYNNVGWTPINIDTSGFIGVTGTYFIN